RELVGEPLDRIVEPQGVPVVARPGTPIFGDDRVRCRGHLRRPAGTGDRGAGADGRPVQEAPARQSRPWAWHRPTPVSGAALAGGLPHQATSRARPTDRSPSGRKPSSWAARGTSARRRRTPLTARSGPNSGTRSGRPIVRA